MAVFVPKRYYVRWWKIIQPNDRRFDALAGTMYWSDTQQAIIVESLTPKYEAIINSFMGATVEIEHGLLVSAVETPKEWIRNLHLAKLGHGLYATQFMELVDETE